jgi:Mg-chelatase subunit ChlD
LNVTIHQSVAGGEYPAADDHGTAVAGIMAATADNGKGPVGVTSTAAMLHYGVTENALALSAYSRAFGYIVDLIALIDEDVKVVNISENTSRLIGFAADRGNENARKYLQQSAKIVEAALARRISSGSEFILCMAAGNNNNLSYTKNEGATYGWEKSNKGESGNVDAKYNNFINLIENETVKSHIVVVGSIGIDDAKSTDSRTGYAYSRFSNVGARVDIVGPGERIYSTVVDGYGTTIRADGKVYSMDGTSFSAPHVSGVAALIFACNPNLTGAEVKRILVDSTSQEFYYHQGHSGLIDAEMAVRNALRSRHQSVEQVTANRNGGNLDLCFVVDTTGSMGDDIDNAKENMDRILDAVTAKSPGYRVALVDYRDYPDRTNDSSDYPAKTQLAFSSDVGTIKNAIQALDLGYGGDDPETVYSGLMRAIGLDWRPEAKKVIIIIGDAPPHDPEPNTGYTYDQTLAALYSADIGISTEDSDYDRIFGSMEVSEISVFAIGADASDAAATFLEELAMDTQGSFEDVEEAADISRALIDSIEQIELAPTQDALASFDPLLAGSRIELYRDDEYVLDFPLDEDGARELVRMEIGEYRWVSPKYGASGALEIEEGADSASVTTRTDPVDPAAANTYSRSTTVALFVSCVCLFVIFGLSSALVLALKRR